MRPALSALAILALAACQGSRGQADDKRTTLAEDGVSYVEPAGYVGHRDRDTWVLSGEGDRARSTIAIRIAKNDDWATDTARGRPAEVVIPATAAALGALPDATVTKPIDRAHPIYQASQLDVEFTPKSRGGERYSRRHVVLFADQRVIHIFHTAPASRLGATDADFARVVDSLREEG